MRVSGVYVFWDADGTCIYVGSSIDMHGRVKTNKHRKLAARVERSIHDYLPDQIGK